MAIGPVQLLLLGFEQPDFQGELRRSWTGSATTAWCG